MLMVKPVTMILVCDAVKVTVVEAASAGSDEEKRGIYLMVMC